MKKIIKRVTLSLATVFLLAACNTVETGNGKVLNLASASAANSLNHMTTTEAVNFDVLNNLVEGLTRKDFNGEIEPAMAKSWDISEDKTVYTFHLRDAKWSNGTPVTANDFVFAWQKLATLKDASYTTFAAWLKNGEAIVKGDMPASELGAKAIDDKTLEVTLERPTAFILQAFSTIIFGPTNEAFYNEVGGDEVFGTSMATVLSNGPYELTEYDGEIGHTLKKRVDYWDAKNVDIETVNVKVVKELETQSVLFDNGEIDKLNLTGTLIDKYADADNIEEQLKPQTTYMFISPFTLKSDATVSNINFRKAIAYSIDKKIITEHVLKDGSLAADGLVPRGFAILDGKDYREESGQYEDLYFNVDKANEFLAAAKSELGSDNLKFTLTISSSTNVSKVFENVKEQVEKNLPGVTVDLQVLPSQTYFTAVRENGESAAYSGWGADFDDIVVFFNIFKTNSGETSSKYSSVDYDTYTALAESPEIAVNPQKRWETYFKAEKTLLEDAVIIPLYQAGQKIVTKNGFTNFTYKTGQPVRHYRLVKQG